MIARRRILTARRNLTGRRRKRKIFLVLMAISAGFRVSCVPQADDGYASDYGAEVDHAFLEDLRRIQSHDRGLGDVLEYARRNPEMLPDPRPGDEPVKLRRADKTRLRQTYAALLDHMQGLDGMKNFWQQVAREERGLDADSHARAYLLSYAAWLVQYRRGLEWVELTVPNKALETILDEAAPAQGIEAGSFARLKLNIIHVRSVGQLFAGYRFYRMLDDELDDAGCLREAECRRAMERVEENYLAARTHLLRRGLISFGYNAWDIVRDTTFDAWFPIQAGAARWMGDTRLARKHRHLISPAQVREMGEHLEPGDILVTRSNWYLSNAGLPGFWPHSELYIGTPADLRAYFDDEQVRRYYRQNTDYDGLIDALRHRYPEAWAVYTRADSDGLPRAILEARSEGVVFNSLQQAVEADYAAAMRPRADKLAQARAIEAAFAHWGKPYDFNFDFLTDRKLVCTELVYKAWQPGPSKDGVRFELTEVMGRTTLPANSLVEQFDRGYDGGERTLEFVYFLDGREGRDAAVVSDLAAFRESWRRPKWGFMQR
jgi:hypothetical protein